MTDIDTIDSAWRENEVLNDPGTAKYHPLKAPQRRVLKRIESLASKGTVAKALEAELQGLVKPADTPALVYGDPDKAKRGWYTTADGDGTWTKVLDIGETVAELEVTGGTNNAVQVSVNSYVDAANVLVFYIDIPAEDANTEPVTVSIAGDDYLPAYNANGDEFAPGEWQGRFLLSNEGTSLRALISPGAEAAAAQSATDANAAADRAETAESVAVAAAASAASANYVSRTILKAVVPSVVGQIAYLGEEGREGKFRWRVGNYAAQVSADPLEGIYIAVDSDPTGAAGVWERVIKDGAVYPEYWGGIEIGDGVTPATAAWQAAITSGFNVRDRKGATYYTTASLGTPANDNTTIHIQGYIIADWEQGVSGEYEGVFELSGRDKISFIGTGEIEYIGTFDFGTSYAGLVSGIWANECDDLVVRGLEIHGFNRCAVLVGALASGATLGYAARPAVERLHAHHNRVAGVAFGQTEDGVVDKCQLHWNGHVSDIGTGYGFTGWSAYVPKNTIVAGTHANDNFRKGIDFHGGHDGTITANFCKRNRVMGIYADGPTGTWIIIGNQIGEMEWDNTFSTAAMYGILVGSQAGQGTSSASTSFLISGNTIVDFTKTAGSAWPIFLYGEGLSYGDIKISTNTIRVGTVDQLLGSSNSDPELPMGNWYDASVNDNTFEAAACDDANALILVNGIRNRQKQFNRNNVSVASVSTTAGVYSYVATSITGHGLIAGGNSINVPATAWSAIFDPIFVRRIASEHMFGNIVNGAPTRDWNGQVFLIEGVSVPPASNFWTVGSRAKKSGAVTAGGVPGYVCITAGTPGVWKDEAPLAA
jgi:hypothetical protein